MVTRAAVPAVVPDAGADERAVRQALAVPTRAAIYRVLRTEGSAHSAREIGDRIGIHANVARAHLDVLVDAGLATAGSRHNPTGGRPAKVYVAHEQHGPTPRRTPPVPSGAIIGLQTALQLVAGLREHVARAELLAEDQGRRIVGASGGRSSSRAFEAALLVALEALRTAFPGAHLRVSDRGSVIDGVRSELDAVGDVDAALADALAVGIVRGALAAAGANADVEVAEGTVRARPAAGDGALPLPAASVDARDVAFDRGVVRAMQAIGRLRPGAHLEVLTDAAGAPAAFARWADRAGHRITAVDRVRDHDGRPAVRILIRRAAGR
jgi:predicted ArsR family transcriptional regulator/TusA-related sulfurtransferase